MIIVDRIAMIVMAMSSSTRVMPFWLRSGPRARGETWLTTSVAEADRRSYGGIDGLDLPSTGCHGVGVEWEQIPVALAALLGDAQPRRFGGCRRAWVHGASPPEERRRRALHPDGDGGTRLRVGHGQRVF